MMKRFASLHFRHRLPRSSGAKTQAAATAAGQRVPEALDVAREKTGVSLRKAADATGDFLQRAGEKIEEKAGEAAEP